MIEIKTYEKDHVRKFHAQIEGELMDVCKDTGYIVRGIYDAISKICHDDADAYREVLIMAINDTRFLTLDNTGDESTFIDMSSIKSGGNYDEK